MVSNWSVSIGDEVFEVLSVSDLLNGTVEDTRSGCRQGWVMALGMDTLDSDSACGASDEQWLWVEVVRARNLESNQGMDAYCIVRISRANGSSDDGKFSEPLDAKRMWRSPTAPTTSDPEWFYRMKGPLDATRLSCDAVVVIEVFNEKNFFFDMFPSTASEPSTPRELDEAAVEKVLERPRPEEESPVSHRRRRRGSRSVDAEDNSSDEALGFIEINIALLASRLSRGSGATDAWYGLRGARSGEVRVRTLLLRHRLVENEVDQVWESALYNPQAEAEDHYGFRIPPSCGREWVHLRTYQACREKRRVAEWEAAFGVHFFTVACAQVPHVVKQYARGGIPRHWRQRVYMSMSGASAKRDAAASGYYVSLVERIDAHDSVSFRQIELDIDRTFGHSKTKISSEEGRATLRRVLKAYSLHNPSVGYCQGLNFIAGFLSLLVDEESTFWLLAMICEEMCPGYYIPSMTDTQTDMLVLKQLIAEELPELDEFTVDVGLPLELLSSQWFLCLFTTTFPAETAFRIFDCLFTDGAYFVFPVILAHLRRLEKTLLGLDDFQTVLTAMKGAENALLDGDAFVDQAVREAQKITPERVQELREHHRATVHEGMERADRARALNRQLAVVYEIPAFSTATANLLRFFHEEAEMSNRSDVAFVLTLLCHGLVWLAEHSKRFTR